MEGGGSRTGDVLPIRGGSPIVWRSGNDLLLHLASASEIFDGRSDANARSPAAPSAMELEETFRFSPRRCGDEAALLSPLRSIE